MVEVIKAEERLARFCAGLSPQMQQELLMALQGYHEQFYNELVAADANIILRVQGKVQAMETINKTIQHARTIVSTIDGRRFANKPPTIDKTTASMM
jgi:hypothetical protein